MHRNKHEKKRFVNKVTALSQTFIITKPHGKALDVKDKATFFQTLKARLVKFDRTGGGTTNEELEGAIWQVTDKALVSEKVVHIFTPWPHPVF